MTFSYNLWDEPWIPVINKKGEIQEIGLFELFKNAPNINKINLSSPICEYGIYRLCIAIIIDIFKFKTRDEIGEFISMGEFKLDMIETYRKENYDFFDLFHEKYPFYQQIISDEKLKSKKKSIVELFPQFPTGNNVMHFFHEKPEDQAFSPAVCAQALCTVPAFMGSGGAGYSPGINGTPPWYCLITGNNLFETLCLNCCEIELPANSGDQKPFWRWKEPIIQKRAVKETSTLFMFSWMSRIIQLIPEKGGICTYSNRESDILVKKIIFSFGLKWDGNDSYIDPHVAYRSTSKGRFPFRPSSQDIIWKDVAPYFLLSQEQLNKSAKMKFSKPLNIQNYQHWSNVEDILPTDLNFHFTLYALQMDKAKVFKWIKGEINFPKAILNEETYQKIIRDSIDNANYAAIILKSAIKMIYPHDGKGNKLAFDNIVQQALYQYWQKLEKFYKNRFIPELISIAITDENALGELLQRWNKHFNNIGIEVLEKILSSFNSTGFMIQQSVKAERFFKSVLHKKFFTN